MSNNSSRQGMLYRTLGSTGEKVSAIGIGGWHLGLPGVDGQLSLRIIRTAVDRGINFMDNCWDYNEGASEIRMGKALRDGYRDRVFLMTKMDGRSKKERLQPTHMYGGSCAVMCEKRLDFPLLFFYF